MVMPHLTLMAPTRAKCGTCNIGISYFPSEFTTVAKHGAANMTMLHITRTISSWAEHEGDNMAMPYTIHKADEGRIWLNEYNNLTYRPHRPHRPHEQNVGDSMWQCDCLPSIGSHGQIHSTQYGNSTVCQQGHYWSHIFGRKYGRSIYIAHTGPWEARAPGRHDLEHAIWPFHMLPARAAQGQNLSEPTCQFHVFHT